MNIDIRRKQNTVKALIVASLIALFSSTVVASESEKLSWQVFECILPPTDYSVPNFALTAISGDTVSVQKGKITYYRTKPVFALQTMYNALYQQEGLDRKWDFGLADNLTDYALIIEPDMTGLYFDFSDVETSETARPTYRLKCKRTHKSPK